MTRSVSKGEAMPGLGLCIGYFPCGCGREHQVFEQGGSKGVFCSGKWSTLTREMIQERPAESRKVQVPQGK